MKLGYVILYVPDVAASVAFYEQAFGLQRAMVMEDYAELETGGTRLAFVSEELAASHGTGFRPTRREDAPPGVEVGLVTDEVAAAVERATAAGAVLVMAPTHKPWGQTIAYVRDLNGILVELCTPVG
jgi:lactoylglutathione lyase